jgi:serine/alanine adding enzyme
VIAVLEQTQTRTVNLLSEWDRFQPAWDEYVHQHSKGNVFHTSQMVRVFSAAKRHSVLPLAAFTPDGEVLAMLVAVRVQTLPSVFGAVSSRSIWYAEPLCSDDPESINALSQLIGEHDRIMGRRVLFTEIRPLYESGPERVALERNGYKYLDYLNFIVDTTQPKDQLWKRLHESVRRNIRKCERRGLQVRTLKTAASVDLLYEFLESTYIRASVPLADRSLFEAAQAILQPEDMVDLVAVYDGDTPLAAYMALIFKGRIYFWYGGSVRMPGVWPVDQLHWHEITQCSDQGWDYYDLGGAGWPDVPYGVRDYKAKFGGELVNYGRYRKVHSPWKFAIAERAYDFRRAILARLQRSKSTKPVA